MSELLLETKTKLVTTEDPSPTISVLWDRAVQQAVINTAVGPTIASRAYAMMHTAMYDAWATYDPIAIPTHLENELQRPETEINQGNKEEGMSYAAYRVLIDLFPEQKAIFDQLMTELGYKLNNVNTDTNNAAGIGNLSAQKLLEFRHQDGSNQLGESVEGTLGVAYSDTSHYQAVNTVENITNIQYWTPEYIPIDDTTGKVQQCLTPHWGEVIPFALETGEQFRPKSPEPFLLVPGEVNFTDQTITLADGSIVEIDRNLIGTIINPQFIQQAKQIVKISANLTDRKKLIAEFWEDGKGTSFPPGTWMSFGEYVSARDNNSLDDDAKLFFTLSNAVFDAGIATWDAKAYYDYTRPVRAIRELGKLGLIGKYNSELGGYAIEAWQPNQGTQSILAEDFLTYQNPKGNPSPPFAEYTSGHSAFSAAGATVLKKFTGSDDFGASFTFTPGSSSFEPEITPKKSIELTWSTFSQAAKQAGKSRLYGGIHFADGNTQGRILGKQVGNTVFEKAQQYINGEIDHILERNHPIDCWQNNSLHDRAYLFVGEEELKQINTNFAENLQKEGITFPVGIETDNDSIPMYRFHNIANLDYSIFGGETERATINRDTNLSEAFGEEYLAFHFYEEGYDRSNTMMGNYLYFTETERDNILNNYADSFTDEGIAFSAKV